MHLGVANMVTGTVACMIPISLTYMHDFRIQLIVAHVLPLPPNHHDAQCTTMSVFLKTISLKKVASFKNRTSRRRSCIVASSSDSCRATWNASPTTSERHRDPRRDRWRGQPRARPGAWKGAGWGVFGAWKEVPGGSVTNKYIY